MSEDKTKQTKQTNREDSGVGSNTEYSLEGSSLSKHLLFPSSI